MTRVPGVAPYNRSPRRPLDMARRAGCVDIPVWYIPSRGLSVKAHLSSWYSTFIVEKSDQNGYNDLCLYLLHQLTQSVNII